MATPTEQEDTQREKECKVATPTEQGYKVFNDPIHGSMKLHPLLVKIIDTPQFQRLRDIKQLGGAYWVFPGASHNRFEHSIGVCYLAGELVKALRSQDKDDKELDITAEDVLCVQVAGLCHDLGHGPFSHMFDKWFIPEAQKRKKCPNQDCPGEKCPEEKCPKKEWKHEDASVMMFDHLVEENNLSDIMVEYGLNLPDDLVFIRELINGRENADKAMSNRWPNKDRKEKKHFLYEIVANSNNGIDVDKWDYFARDSYHLGVQNNFDHRRYIAFAKVCKDEKGKRHICIRDKEIRNVSDMFQTRRNLHLKVLQHRVIRVVEIMIMEAFLEADEHFRISAAIYDPRAYTKLTDHVFHEILNSSGHDLENARTILRNVVNRKFYRFVGQTRLFEPIQDPKDVLKDLKEKLATIKGETEASLNPETDFVFDTIEIEHRIKKEKLNGMERINPLLNVRIYSKQQPEEATKTDEDEMSELLLHNLAQDQIRVYLKRTDKQSQETNRILDEATAKFKEWHEVTFKAWIKDVLKADKKLKLSKPTDDIESDTELAVTSDDPDLKTPREKIPKHDFDNSYKFVGLTRPNLPLPNTQERRRTLEEEIAETVPEGGGPNVDLRAEDFLVHIVSIKYRISRDSNPLDNVRVYTESDRDTGIPILEAQRSILPPNNLAMQLILVYCKTDEQSMETARRKFRQWCNCCGYTQRMEIAMPPEHNPQEQQ